MNLTPFFCAHFLPRAPTSLAQPRPTISTYRYSCSRTVFVHPRSLLLSCRFGFPKSGDLKRRFQHGKGRTPESKSYFDGNFYTFGTRCQRCVRWAQTTLQTWTSLPVWEATLSVWGNLSPCWLISHWHGNQCGTEACLARL